ncbi:integrase arm-type DNA-binding domain-containing protein [Rhizobium leguminosarum]|uniref:Integrase arm-type DNA-binding domain-containing protein n=1 Tax=Rhizobium leguminosarum TaxID=384 RepID=A0AAJ1AAT5_RHILE|nr:site-specific integrase [Rhizobium leguminosarum]MBY5630407.1 integrase arm-type DNA-binding domain-containing protein [Rhizobium leguminosarum]
MARNKLSETKIKSLTKPGVYGDGDGLYIRVQKGGSRNWVFIWRRGEDRNEVGLGGYGAGTAPVSLILAREKADAIRQQLARGEDPRADKKANRPKTFHDCMEALIAAKESEWTNPKHADQWRMTLREYAKPLHQMPVADIVMGDVKDCLLPHWHERPETADRLRSRIQATIDYAIAHEWRTAGNPARWKGLLDKVMPRRQKLQRGHHAALAYAAAPILAANLRASSGIAARAVEFLALTATRTREARLAEFAEFDMKAKTWTVPATRMKMGKLHTVPLSDRAIEIVNAMREVATGPFLFGGDKAVSDTAMTKALRVASPDKASTLHGLRSMFRDWCGDETDHPREVAEQALAHAIGNAIEQAYRRSDAIEKRRALMIDWSNYLAAAPDFVNKRVK